MENLLLLFLRGLAAGREIADPVIRRWMANKLSSVIGAGTTCSALTMGWPTYFREIPTAGFSITYSVRGSPCSLFFDRMAGHRQIKQIDRIDLNS
jgi:hypothetical protein